MSAPQPITPTWLDRVISFVAPAAGARRLQARAAIRSYEAATSTRRTAGMGKVSGSANAESLSQAPILRDRARHIWQNNPWGTKAIGALDSNIVGSGILAQAKAFNKNGSANKPRSKKIQDEWLAWAETKACDYEGTHDLYGLQGLVMQTVARDGMVIARRRWVTGQRIPIQIQLLEFDHLDTGRYRNEGSNRVIQGVEVDRTGRVVAAWLFEDHPGDSGWINTPALSGLTSVRVPAEDLQFIFRKDRVGQLIGITWLAPVMGTLRDLDAYEDAEGLKQITAACFAGFIHDATGADESLSATTDSEDTIERIEPGEVRTLPPGKDITFAEPPSLGGFDTYTRAMLRKTAAGIGLVYEVLTGDYSQVNFSSGRMGWIEFGRNVTKWRWRMLIPMFCEPVWDWFAQAAQIGIGLDTAGVTATWTPPRREMIAPKEEIAALKDAIRSGLASWQETVRELGYDPDALAAEIAADNKRFDELGLVLDCDPRKTAAQGQQQVAQAKPADDLADATPAA